MKIDIGDICVCVDGFVSKNTAENYGGAGYVDGVIFKLRKLNYKEGRHSTHKLDALFGDELIGGGVFRKATRLATQDEVDAYNRGIKNVLDMPVEYKIGYRNKAGESKIFTVVAKDRNDALSRLETSLANHWDELTGVNYIMSEK